MYIYKQVLSQRQEKPAYKSHIIPRYVYTGYLQLDLFIIDYSNSLDLQIFYSCFEKTAKYQTWEKCQEEFVVGVSKSEPIDSQTCEHRNVCTN